MSYALAIHTASPDLGLALSNFAGDDRLQVWADLRQGMSSHLQVYLAEFIRPQTWADLSFIAVAKGPGGFTGTRLGVVTARTLAQQLDIPLFAISTLAAVAWQRAIESNPPNSLVDTPASRIENPGMTDHLAVQMMAHRGELYTAIYAPDREQGFKTMQPDTVMSPDHWQQTLSTWPHPYHLIEVADGLGTTTTALLDLAHQAWQQGERPHWSEALPFYGQSPV